MTTEQKRDEQIGRAIIELLGVNVKENDRVDTIQGDKTPTGLTRTIRRIMILGGQIGG